ncbi:DUF2972 domain-containing protein, partial [Campylobacter jejuni]|nr:DUF2972 domain-containing protein [Campylobacter jejuni]
MHNSAVERVKNQLAYKLGQAMIDYKHNGGGYGSLLINLYKIKKQHEKEERIYKETIQIFPQLQYPDLNTCPDYAQSLKYQFHLSYLLGEALLKAYNTWYKCGGFLLSKNIKKANKDYQSFQEIFKQFDIFNSSLLLGFIENKALFLKEFSRIKKLLKTHQDYKAILDNIFNNFNYVLENFDLIEAWLLSDDFKQRYKEQNHPYPSLLNPQQLNDKNEKINYHNISAELAWQMNLPLPDNYEFINVSPHGSGRNAMENFYTKNRIHFKQLCWANSGYDRYSVNFDSLVKNDNSYSIIMLSEYHFLDMDKFFSLIGKTVPVLLFVRDPISVIKHVINGINFYDNLEGKNITLNDTDFDSLLDTLRFWKYDKDNGTVVGEWSWSKFPHLKNLKPYLRAGGIENSNFFQNSILKSLKHCKKQIYFIDINDIHKDKIHQTMYGICKKFKFDLKANFNDYADQIYTPINALLPFTLHIRDDIKLVITTYHKNKCDNIKNYIDDFCNFKQEFNVVINITDRELNILKQDKQLFKNVRKYVNSFIEVLEQKIKEFE